MVGGGRSFRLSPRQKRSIEMAASWPWATAQMMFFGPNAASPPKNTFGNGRLEGLGVDLRQSGAVEREAEIALDEGKRIFLTDRDQNVVALDEDVGLAGRDELAAPVDVFLRRNLLEHDAREFAVPVREFLWHEEVQDRDALVHGILLLPGRRLHLLEPGTDDHLDVLAAEPPGGPAAIHRRVAAPEHDDAPADPIDMPEGDAGQPVDPDVDIRGRLAASRDFEVAAPRRAGPDEDCVEILVQQGAEAVDPLAVARLDVAHSDDIADLFVDHFLGQPEARDLAANHAAAPPFAVEQDDLVAERREIACHGERGRARTDEGDAFPIPLAWRGRQERRDVVLVVGCDALEAANRDRLVLHAAPATGRFARPVAGAPENPWKDVGLPIHHVSVGVPARRDEANIFRNCRMRRTGPLAIDDFVEVIRVSGIGGRQALPSLRLFRKDCTPAVTLGTNHLASPRWASGRFLPHGDVVILRNKGAGRLGKGCRSGGRLLLCALRTRGARGGWRGCRRPIRSI